MSSAINMEERVPLKEKKRSPESMTPTYQTTETVPASDGDQPWESEHMDLGDGGLRAAVFGFNDGLTTNVCLICGVYITGHPTSTILTTGIAGLLAGAISMCIGEWISMTAQAEGLMHELEVERSHLKHYPVQEKAHLTEILSEHGLSQRAIDAVIEDLDGQSVDKRLHLHARLELGIDPDDLGSPMKAAIFSFISFSVGAIIPLVPWMIWSTKRWNFYTTLILAFVASIIVGSLFSLKSPKGACYNSWRQVIVIVLGVAAAILLNWLIQTNEAA